MSSRRSLNENDIVSLGADWKRFFVRSDRLEAEKADGHAGTRFIAHQSEDEAFWFTTKDGALDIDENNHLVLKPISENSFAQFKIEYISYPPSLPGFYAHFESCDKPGHYLAVGPENSTSSDARFVVLSTEANGDSVIAATYLGTAIEVAAATKWGDSGININVGDSVEIRCLGGIWQVRPASGYVDAAGSKTIAKSGYTLPGVHEGALCGRIGPDGDVFLIGKKCGFTADTSGELYLCINDDLNEEYGAGFVDNTGSVYVTVDIAPVKK